MKSDKNKRRKNNLYTATLLTGTTILVGEIDVIEINVQQDLVKEESNGDDNIIYVTCD